MHTNNYMQIHSPEQPRISSTNIDNDSENDDDGNDGVEDV